jgi:PST family polysaccharide transporter
MEIYPFIALAYFTNALFSLHTATLTLLRHNRDLALFHACHILLFAGSALALVPMLGLRGYGWAEMVALAGYLLLHSLLARAIGSPSYRCAALWWFGVAIGLFWRDLGWWAIAAPFLALLVPPSPLRLRQFHTRLSGA